MAEQKARTRLPRVNEVMTQLFTAGDRGEQSRLVDYINETGPARPRPLSRSAVSSWANGTSTPDIDLWPIIARFFADGDAEQAAQIEHDIRAAAAAEFYPDIIAKFGEAQAAAARTAARNRRNPPPARGRRPTS